MDCISICFALCEGYESMLGKVVQVEWIETEV